MDHDTPRRAYNNGHGGTAPFTFHLGDNADSPIDLDGNYLPDNFGETVMEVSQQNTETDSEDDLNEEEDTIPSLARTGRSPQSSSKPYRVNNSVELYDGTFLHIKRISKDSTLKGIELFRATSDHIGHGFEAHTNELVWMIQPTWNEYRNGHPPSLKKVSPHSVKRKRVIIFTNQILAQEDRVKERRNFRYVRQQEEEGKLYCRWKFLQVLWGNNPIEYAFIHLREEDVRAERWQKSDESIRRSWRGSIDTPGGSYGLDVARDVYVTQLDVTGPSEIKHQVASVQNKQQYTLGDLFCGGGGIGQGAILAGLHLQWAVDEDGAAASTYDRNFSGHGTTVFQQNVFHFIHMAKDGGFQVDILHLSPPCQFFSPAHTQIGRNDEANSAAIFCLEELLKTLRPRQVTLEQTTGLLQTSKHRPYFNAVINSFISYGYSVRWSILHCREYGVPQIRRRLVIMASGPGEKFPEFPVPTYGPLSTSKRPFNTVGSAIVGIPSDAIHHDASRAYFKNGPKPEYSPDTQAYTLTCNGGESYHPDGLRKFTPREMASLQTFPLYHTFHAEDGGLAGVSVAETMIGNAVPPLLAKHVFREVKKALRDVDGM